mmetsp:Transcript_12215/g.49181  ORF Transcript_12215/g.49181 Transcript_12215/m.49181 type:complete len:218 (+) Transcript_12215:1766-2419(+)
MIALVLLGLRVVLSDFARRRRASAPRVAELFRQRPAPIEEVRLAAHASRDERVRVQVLEHRRRARLLRADDQKVRGERAGAFLRRQRDGPSRLLETLADADLGDGHRGRHELWKARVGVIKDEVRPVEGLAQIRDVVFGLVVELDDGALAEMESSQRRRRAPDAERDARRIRHDRAVHAMRARDPPARVVVRRDDRARRHRGEQAPHELRRVDAGSV